MTTIESAPSQAQPGPLPSSTRTEQVVRADDQLRLTIELFNLYVDPMTKLLARVDPANARVRESCRDNYPRLVEVMRRYDAVNMFHVNTNIPPTASQGSNHVRP